LLILDNPKEEEVNESTFCLNIDHLSLVPRKDAMLYDLIEKVPGFLFDSSNKFLIKLPNEDKLDELKHYLNLKSWFFCFLRIWRDSIDELRNFDTFHIFNKNNKICRIKIKYSKVVIKSAHFTILRKVYFWLQR